MQGCTIVTIESDKLLSESKEDHQHCGLSFHINLVSLTERGF